LKEMLINKPSRSVEVGGVSSLKASVDDKVQISTIEKEQQQGLTDREIAKRLADEDAKKFAEILKTWMK